MSTRKNHHFVPKYLLRKFSYNDNQKQIGLFNLSNKTYIERAPLKSEASKNFYYGDDGQVENFLGGIEGRQAALLREVSESLSIKMEGMHFELLALVIMTGLRNPTQIEHWKLFPGVVNSINEDIFEDNQSNIFPPIKHEFIVESAMKLILEGVKFCYDLKIKLLVNKTNKPYIIGDNPTVYYNQFLEKKKWPHNKCGWATIGLQIFLPISPNLTIIIYDSDFYRVGKHKREVVDIDNVADVNNLNLLQLLNCTSNVYFNENVSQEYIKRLYEKSHQFSKPNQPKISYAKLAVDKKIQEGDVIGFGKTDCEIELNFNWIKPTANNLDFVLGSNALYPRLHASNLMNLAVKNMESNALKL